MYYIFFIIIYYIHTVPAILILYKTVCLQECTVVALPVTLVHLFCPHVRDNDPHDDLHLKTTAVCTNI